MYVKTVKQGKEWKFGIEYFYSEVGDVLSVDPSVGLEMLAAGVAVRAEHAEIPQQPQGVEHAPDASRCVFQVILADLAKKGTP